MVCGQRFRRERGNSEGRKRSSWAERQHCYRTKPFRARRQQGTNGVAGLYAAVLGRATKNAKLRKGEDAKTKSRERTTTEGERNTANQLPAPCATKTHKGNGNKQKSSDRAGSRAQRWRGGGRGREKVSGRSVELCQPRKGHSTEASARGNRAPAFFLLSRSRERKIKEGGGKKAEAHYAALPGIERRADARRRASARAQSPTRILAGRAKTLMMMIVGDELVRGGGCKRERRTPPHWQAGEGAGSL